MTTTSNHPVQDGPGPDRPSVVVVMAEAGGAWLWNRSPDRRAEDPYDLDPVTLGVSPHVVAQLDRWNGEGEVRAISADGAFPADVERAWVRRGWQLAHDLQDELPDVEVRYHHDPRGVRPVREGRG